MASSDFRNVVQTDLEATIANGQTTSGEVDLKGTTVCGFHIPATFTGTTLKLSAAAENDSTFRTVMSAGADYSLTVAAGKYVPIENLAIVSGLRRIKLISGSSEAAARKIIIATRPV